jgi:hypothetical protein
MAPGDEACGHDGWGQAFARRPARLVVSAIRCAVPKSWVRVSELSARGCARRPCASAPAAARGLGDLLPTIVQAFDIEEMPGDGAATFMHNIFMAAGIEDRYVGEEWHSEARAAVARRPSPNARTSKGKPRDDAGLCPLPTAPLRCFVACNQDWTHQRETVDRPRCDSSWRSTPWPKAEITDRFGYGGSWRTRSSWGPVIGC